MKRVILASTMLIGLALMIGAFSSCSTLGGASGNAVQTVNKVSNIAQTAQEISGVLGGTLGLNGTQKSSVTSIVSNYIGNTNGIASLASTDKASYAKQLLNFNQGTLGKLKGVLTAAQYAQMLGLGGSKSGTQSSLVSALSGGSSLSSDAKSVLGGLLLNKL